MKYLLIILFSIPIISFAQDEKKLINGVILSESTEKVISYVFIKNISNGNIASAGANGIFNIIASKGDTLSFNHISTFDKQYVLYFISDTLKIYLTDNIQELDEVSTLPSYKNFQKQLLALKIEDTKPKIYIPGVKIQTEPGIPPPITIGNPLSFIASKLSKKEKEKIEYRRVLLEQKELKNYHDRLNIEFIQHITKLEGEELNKFMTYCKFEKGFVLTATDYELTVSIKTCFEEFKKSNS